jgi:hypothetical protein
MIMTDAAVQQSSLGLPHHAPTYCADALGAHRCALSAHTALVLGITWRSPARDTRYLIHDTLP